MTTGARGAVLVYPPLREKQWAARTREMAAVLDDPDPSRWLTLEEVRECLEKSPNLPGSETAFVD